MSQADQIYRKIGSDLDMMSDVKGTSEVQKFYNGKTVFITGATGFMGMCLVEKLLRTCPNVKHIYLLIREKKGLAMKDRLGKYFNDKLFDKLIAFDANITNKVSGISGNLDSEKCGISDEDLDLLKKETNIIFHAAADVMFTSKIKQSLKINVLGTKNIIELAEQCPYLESFIYLSTAYSHCYMKCIEDKLYDPPGDLSMVYKMIEVDEQKGIDGASLHDWIGKYPNIYTFSKAMCEELVRQYSLRSTHTCGIYRPSIVGSTYKKPIAGWSIGLNLIKAVCAVYALGLFHVAYHHLDPIDIIPCDLSINALVALPWDLKERWSENQEKEAVVYNYASSCVNPVFANIISDAFKYDRNLPRSRYAASPDFMIYTSNWTIYRILDKFFHFIPACIADMVLFIMGKKRRALDIYRKIQKNHDQVDYWGNGNWRIHMTNVPRLMDRLNTVDRELFFCDLKQVDWSEWVKRSWKGFLTSTLGEEIPNKKGERHYILLLTIQYGITAIFLFTVIYLLSWILFWK